MNEFREAFGKEGSLPFESCTAPRAKIREESLENAMARENFKEMTNALRLV